MKVKLGPVEFLNNKQQKELTKYIKQQAFKLYDEEANGLIRRCYKTIAVALHRKHGFGRTRIMQLMDEVSDISKLRSMDDVFWRHIDDIIINEIKLEFNREKYDDLDK